MGQFGTVAVIGVGLIGGSIGLALRTRSLAARVVGIGRHEASLVEALHVGALDAYTTNLAEGVTGAEVLVVCTPVGEIAASVRRAAALGPAELLVTDAGSTKRSIVETVEDDARARSVFVGGHPIAGSERKGVAFADVDLFEGRACVLTPTALTPPDRLRRAREFWSALGCQVVELSPEAHDEALALTSHLPHAVAAALAATVPSELLGLAAGAYRDGTRVAGSDAALWAGIFLENRGPLLHAVSQFEAHLADLRAALERGDEEELRSCWELARSRRSRYDRPGGTKPQNHH
ncbi:MAG: prephenate dehydrogenase/arogenate dehydrogenase family protein [Isosphaeraceae bacterium]